MIFTRSECDWFCSTVVESWSYDREFKFLSQAAYTSRHTQMVYSLRPFIQHVRLSGWHRTFCSFHLPVHTIHPIPSSLHIHVFTGFEALKSVLIPKKCSGLTHTYQNWTGSWRGISQSLSPIANQLSQCLFGSGVVSCVHRLFSSFSFLQFLSHLLRRLPKNCEHIT